MSEHFKFSQHKKCEYFPCHKTTDEEKFNCLFCYCPLYLLKDKCGGNFRYVNGIKDCSNCMIPHTEKAHDYVMSKMGVVMKMARYLKEDKEK